MFAEFSPAVGARRIANNARQNRVRRKNGQAQIFSFGETETAATESKIEGKPDPRVQEGWRTKPKLPAAAYLSEAAVLVDCRGRFFLLSLI